MRSEEESPDFDPVAAMAVTRPLVMEQMLERLHLLREQADHWDAECDRAFAEIWWLIRWIEGRISRNESAYGNN